jgi:hypothetical protein
VGPLGEKWRPLVGNLEEWYVESRHLQSCSPRLCRIRTGRLAPRKQVLNVPITRWYMGPVSLVAYYWQLCGFLHFFYGGEGERNWMGTRRSVSRRAGDVVGNSFFSRAMSNSIDDFMKGCYTWTAWDMYGRGSYVDWAWKACGVLVEFPPAGCTSIRITVTLGYEYRLFVAVFM